MQIRSVALSAALVLFGASAFGQGYPQQQGNYPPPQPGYQQQGPGQYGGPQGPGGWDQIPGDYNNDFQRQGFRDGIGAARADFEQHRPPNSTNTPQYRHPPTPKRARNDYRAGFQRGYDVATRHMMERHEERREEHRDGYPPPYPPR